MRRCLISLAILSLAASGCGSDGGEESGPGCTLPFLGDPDLPVEMAIVFRNAEGVSEACNDGDEVPMIRPPQGGQVIFAAARATNIAACGVMLSGVLRDPNGGQIRVDARTQNLIDDGNGWGGPIDAVISSFSNIPTCPNQWATTDLYDQEFELEVTLTDPEGRTATRTLNIIPVCGEARYEQDCLCQCAEGYVMGEVCGEGTGAGTGEGSM